MHRSTRCWRGRWGRSNGLVPMTTIIGAFTGWIVGWFFGDTILTILSQLGVHDANMWQWGAFLGFLSGFLKTKVSAEVKAAK